jgi:hypothetical protein
MDKSESDVGYPEEQPDQVDDTPAEGRPQRQGGKAGNAEGPGDDGKATGNPHDDPN